MDAFGFYVTPPQKKVLASTEVRSGGKCLQNSTSQLRVRSVEYHTAVQVHEELRYNTVDLKKLLNQQQLLYTGATVLKPQTPKKGSFQLPNRNDQIRYGFVKQWQPSNQFGHQMGSHSHQNWSFSFSFLSEFHSSTKIYSSHCTVAVSPKLSHSTYPHRSLLLQSRQS